MAVVGGDAGRETLPSEKLNCDFQTLFEQRLTVLRNEALLSHSAATPASTFVERVPKVNSIDGTKAAEVAPAQSEDSRRPAPAPEHEKGHRVANGGQIKRRRGRPPDILREYRREKIQRVAETGKTGEPYCKALDEVSLQTPIPWHTVEGCPKSYLEAWNLFEPKKREKWRKRINDERYNATHRKPHP